MQDVERRLQQVEFPAEHHAEVLGDYDERRASRRQFFAVGVTAALGILLLLQVAFGSWRQAAIVMMALPAALAGGLVAAFALGAVVTFGTVAGLLAVLAIAIRGSTLLVVRLNELRDEQPLGPALVVGGVRERVGPMVTTSLVTALALVPLWAFGNIAGLEVIQPMAVVVFGGLFTSTLVVLLVVPASYLRFAPKRRAAPLDLGPMVDVDAPTDPGAALTASAAGRTSAPREYR